MRIRIREARIDDISEIIRVERKAWPNGLSATEEKFRARIQTFPEGNLVAIYNNNISGVVSTEIIKYRLNSNENKNWYELTDNGYIKGTHTLGGNILFGVDLSVIPEMQNRGIATKLLQEIGKLIIRRNIKWAMLGGRLPGYHKYAAEMSVDDYVKKKIPSGEYLDPELNFYLRAGLKLERVIPNYFQDPESLHFGVLMLWENPFFIKNAVVGKIVGRFFSMVFKAVK